MTKKIPVRGRRKKSASRKKEVFFKVLPWSAVMLLVLALAGLGFWLDRPTPPVKAAGYSQAVIAQIGLYDTNNNGKIDQVKLTIGNPEGDTWTAGTAGSTVNYGGKVDLTISGAEVERTGSENPVVVDINLDESDPNLLVNTDGVINGPIEYSYSQVGIGGGGIDDGVGGGEELENIAGDDSAPRFTEYDRATPVLMDASYTDLHNSGTVDEVDLTFSEATILNAITPADWSFSTPGDINLSGVFDILDCTANGSGDIYSCSLVGGNVTADTNKTGKQSPTGAEPVLSYLNNDLDILDSAGNYTASFDKTLTDNAAPVLLLTSPANGSTGVALNAPLVLTFSETMDQTTLTSDTVQRDPDFTLGAATWNAGVLTVTYSSHADLTTSQLYTITLNSSIASLAPDDKDLASSGGVIRISGFPGSGVIPGPGKGSLLPPNPFTFTTTSSPGGTNAGTNTVNETPSLTIEAPNGGETLTGGEPYEVKWSSTGTVINKVKLYYSLDGGINFSNVITADETNDGAYSWTVPNTGSTKAKIKIEGYDLADLLAASDISDKDFSIAYNVSEEGENQNEGTNEQNPPAGTETPVVNLQPGDLIKSSLSPAVYYYGSDNKRHLFPDERTYKTWYIDFSAVKNVSDSGIRALSPGQNVTIRPGTVLVKITTDARVYAVEPGGVLRWIPNEARAATLYGTTWARKVVDVPFLVFWADYTFGADITSDTHPTGALVKYSASPDVYYIQNGEKRKFTSAGFTANNFHDTYVLTIPADISYTDGADITGAEDAVSMIY